MADFTKVKRQRTLGSPPPLSEASPNLDAPEVAPAPVMAGPQDDHLPKALSKIDGRSLRRTNRTVAFATRVSPEFDARIRKIAGDKRLLIVEVLEQALDAYDKASS